MVLNRKIAYVDLSKGEIVTNDIPNKMRRLYLGGRGIDMYLLYNHIKSGIDAMGPENTLMIGAGLLGCIPGLGSGRFDIAAKSPLTGAVGSSAIGGFFAPELRFAGFDHLAITGRAEKPVYLWVHDGEIEIKDASHLWGKDTVETQTAIREDHHDDEIQSVVIGLAGENLVRFANVMNGMKNSAGRTGMGCVMGSKKLKAIAARGTMDLEFAHPDELLDYCKEMNDRVTGTKFGKALQKWGTMIIYSNTGTTGLIRCRNFQYNRMEKGDVLECENMDKYSIGMSGCYACSMHCRHRYILTEGPYAPFYDEGPEYTSQGAFGTEPDCPSLETVLVANHLVNKYGIDTLEIGSIIAWAMELYEKGIINEKMTDGLRLEWGSSEAIIEMIHKISKREGFGNILADGLRPAIEKIGKESEYYAIHVKGMSNLHSDERATPSFALGIAASTRGSDHLRGRPAIDLYGLPEDLLKEIYGGPVSSLYTSYEGKSRMVWWHELNYAVVDSLGLCKFQSVFMMVHAPKYEEWMKLLYYATGMEFSKEELMTIGERIYTTERMFNIREGFSRKDDTLPERYFKEPTPIGYPIARNKKIDRKKFEKMLDEYYELHGWSLEGEPTEQTLKKLELDKEPSHML